jgi:hypothetical protein
MWPEGACRLTCELYWNAGWSLQEEHSYKGMFYLAFILFGNSFWQLFYLTAVLSSSCSI